MHTHGDGPGRRQRFKERLEILRDSALHHQVRTHLSARHWTRRQWIHASLFTTIGIMLATIVPGFSTVVQTAPVVEPQAVLPLALPQLSEERSQGTGRRQLADREGEARPDPGFAVQGTGHFQRDAAAHPQDGDAKASLTKLKPGTELAFDLPVSGELRTLRYDRDADHRRGTVAGRRHGQAKGVARESTTRTVVLSGKVGRSLNRSARKAGLTSANINSLTDEIFKYDIDFDSDLDADDRFSVVVDQTWREGELVSTSPVLAATFTVDGKLHSGFRYARTGSKPEYFTAQGRPLKKTFIRMPIPYARLSSRFGARKHPVLGAMRMHKGVDYAASSGTPIMAAGDSRVEFIGWQRGYGNTVVLNHGRGYTTLYGHMSRTAKLRKGQSVAQGTVIGYVGSTGMSTGPHLHYEFRVNGAHRNPLSITMPPPEPLAGAQLASYRTYTANALARIRTVENIIYADVEPAAACPGQGADCRAGDCQEALSRNS